MSEAEWSLRNWKLSFARLDSWLDEKPAARHLADRQLAQIAVDAMFWFAGARYDLLAFVVMPSHIHGVFQPSYDHWVRDVEELERIIRYIEANPVKAGLCQSSEEWMLSSAHCRKLAGSEFGEALVLRAR